MPHVFKDIEWEAQLWMVPKRWKWMAGRGVESIRLQELWGMGTGNRRSHTKLQCLLDEEEVRLHRQALKESWLGKRWKAQGSAYVVASICNRSSWVDHHRFKASLIYLAVLGPSMATWHNLVSENKIKTKPKETNKEFWKAAEHTTLWVVVYSSRWVNECLQCIC